MKRSTWLGFAFVILAVCQVGADAPVPQVERPTTPDSQQSTSFSNLDGLECSDASLVPTASGSTSVGVADCGPCSAAPCRGQMFGTICGLQGGQFLRCWESGKICPGVPDSALCVCGRVPP